MKIQNLLLNALDDSPDSEGQKERFLGYLEKEGIEVNPEVSIRGEDCSKKIREYYEEDFLEFSFFWNFGFKRLLYPLVLGGHSGDSY